MSRPDLSIVIPLYNEAEALRNTLMEIQHQVKSTGLKYEIILIDDGSIDDTWDIISVFSQNCQEIKGLKLSRNFGKESAISTGMEYSKGNAVIIMDGDGQHPPDLIPEMVKCWQEGYGDIIEAVKKERGNETISSKIGAKVFYWLMKHLTDINLEGASDFKLLSRKVVDAHNRLSESSRFFRGIISWLGFKRAQIPFSVKQRTGGKSGWSIIQLIKLALDATTAFSALPLHLITIMGLITFALSFALSIHTLYMKFSGTAVSGFATVILLLLFIASILMLSLGIIGMYISRIFDEVKRRPGYIIEKMINV